MAMRTAFDGLRKYYLSRSELILRTLPRFAEPIQFEQSYKDYLMGIGKSRGFNGRFNDDLVSFPLKSFKKFPKSTIDKLIKLSYDVLKGNSKINSHFLYNSVLRSYMTHDIDCDISALLKDMSSNSIRFNLETYTLLIDLYSKRGDMATVENLINAMKTNDLVMGKKTKHRIYGGYIRAEKFDEAEKFRIEENLDETEISFLVQKAKANADLGNFSEVINIVKTIGEIDENMPSKICTNIYIRLVKAKVSDSDLDKVLEIPNTSMDTNNLTHLLFLLNRDGFYNHSLKLMLRYKDKLIDSNVISDIISSFNNIDCPINTYNTVLENFIGRIHPRATISLFSNMTLDDAFKLTLKIMTPSTAQCLMSNLLMKAVIEKDVTKIQDVLQLAVEKVPSKDLNTVVQYMLLPSLLEHNLIVNPQDILKLLPQHRMLILPCLFMHFLCKGDFSSFQSLLSQQHFSGPLNYLNFSRLNAKSIIDNVPFKEIDRVVVEASRVFPPQFVNFLGGSVVCEKIIQQSKVNNETGIQESVKVAKGLGVTLERSNFDYLKNHTIKHHHLIVGLGAVSVETEKATEAVEEEAASRE